MNLAITANSTSGNMNGSVAFRTDVGYGKIVGCILQKFEAVIIGVNIVSLIINALHLMILSQLKRMRGTVFHKILSSPVPQTCWMHSLRYQPLLGQFVLTLFKACH